MWFERLWPCLTQVNCGTPNATTFKLIQDTCLDNAWIVDSTIPKRKSARCSSFNWLFSLSNINFITIFTCNFINSRKMQLEIVYLFQIQKRSMILYLLSEIVLEITYVNHLYICNSAKAISYKEIVILN